MRLSKRVLQNMDADRVRRINEIYHNLENTGYDAQHEDIPQFEAAFWKEAARKYLHRAGPIVWLDYGTGTGFVPSTVGEYMRAEDRFICCDVSGEMLKACEAKLKSRSLPCACSFAKIDGQTVPAQTGSVDVISVNSVLHHLFDLDAFAAECRRVLKPVGLLIVAHEPNGNTSLPLSGRLLRGLARAVFRPKTLLFAIADHSPVAERFMRAAIGRVSPRYRRRNQMLAEIARQIRQEGLLDFNLRGTEIQQIVDFQSQHGFDPEDLFGRIFSRFAVLESQTYGHLGFYPSGRGPQAADRYLKRRWPDAGREICFVLQRVQDQ